MLPLNEINRILSRVGNKKAAASFEGEHLDFKRPDESAKKTLNALADASVCFANATGGTIILGVDDKATTRVDALVGVPASLTTDAIRKGIFERTRPSLTVWVEEHQEDDVRLIVINVPQGALFHANASGTATRRMGSDCVPFSPAEQRQMLEARGQIDWSAEPTSLTLEGVAASELDRLRTLLSEAGKSDLAQQSAKGLLESLRLLTGTGHLTRAAVLLLSAEDVITSEIPSWGYSYQYRPSPGAESATKIRRSEPLLAAVEEILAAVEARSLTHPLNMAGGIQLQLVDYPQPAVREIVVNALVHRSMDGPGTVDIDHSPATLAVTSPGPFVAGVTPENVLTHPSTPRHRLLFDVVAMCQLAERTGQGVDRAYREMLRTGKRPPSFEDSGFLVRASLEGGVGNDAFVRFVNDLPEHLARDVDVLLTLDYLRSARTVSAPRLASTIQRTPAEAAAVLARLSDERMLEPTRSTAKKPHPAYTLRSEPLAALGRAVTYPRRLPDEIDAKVIEHVREYGYVTNRTLQRLFDMHVYRARDLLLDLRSRGILEKVGEARGGPGVKYEAGPRFPTEKVERAQPQLPLDRDG